MYTLFSFAIDTKICLREAICETRAPFKSDSIYNYCASCCDIPYEAIVLVSTQSKPAPALA